MGEHNNGVPSITEPWPAKDIVYISIIAPVVLAAFLEWLLWLVAFLYCLVKVYQKAEHWSTKVLAVVIMIVFCALRCIFLPVMIVTIPLPTRLTQCFPKQLVFLLQWFAFWTFAVLLTLPWLFCVYWLVTNSWGKTKKIKQVLDDPMAPKTVIVMPVYKEDPTVLIRAVNSVVDCDYPATCIHIFLSYDGAAVDKSYLKVAHHLAIPALRSYPQSIDVIYKGARITLSRFKHGGKRHCQKQTFRLIDKIYADYLKQHDDLFVLLIDSDCILDRMCLQNFMYDMELKPGSGPKMIAMTGVITATTEKLSLITILQDMEYIHGQLFERSVESGCGAVTCLPGALTILRFSAFRKIAKYYFADEVEQCEDLFDYGKYHLGEDRWLTHLFMIYSKERYKIQMCAGAFCKTEAVQTFRSLLKQRRRWFLGFITNEVCMLTDVRLWKCYPLLCLIRVMQNTIRTTALLFFIMVISIITTSNKVKNLPVGFIAISLGLNYLLMFYLGARLRRFKIWLYPLMFILNPFFNWLYMVYGIFTAGQRTWGGPRADAAAADEHTTPKEAVEQATAQGDELNVNVETFRRWMLTHPSERVGCCSAEHPNESGHNLSQLVTPLLPDVPRLPLQPRQSFDSMVTTDTSTCSICMSRRVESTTAEDDQMNLYPDHQAQRLSSLRKDPAESDNMDCANSAPFLRKTNPREWEMHELGVQPPFQTPQTPGLETIYHITRPETTLDPSRYLRPTRQRLGRSTPKWLFQDWNGDEDASEAGPSAESVHDLEGLRCKRGKKRRWISENPQDPVYIA